MPDHLFVLLGAGASLDCASGHVTRIDNYRPPLTSQLFDSKFESILNLYPLAESAAADIRPAVARDPIALEAFLRETLRDSPHRHLRRQFRAIPLYLQHLLFDISAWDPPHRGYTAHADNYSRLITAALELDEAVFITLNYDILLDRRLFVYADLVDMDSYIKAGENWSLIKPHGSVNWGRQVLSAWDRPSHDVFLAATFAALGDEFSLDEHITLRLAAEARGLRHEGADSSGGGGRLYYPALSAPLGPGDELVCPPNHVAHLREKLRAYDGLHLLVIGYSGLDDEVLKLLRESENSLRSLTVVSESEEAAIKTKNAITGAIGLAGFGLDQLISSGFDEYARSEGMRRRIDGLT
jgi:hypothetical protein